MGVAAEVSVAPTVLYCGQVLSTLPITVMMSLLPPAPLETEAPHDAASAVGTAKTKGGARRPFTGLVGTAFTQALAAAPTAEEGIVGAVAVVFGVGFAADAARAVAVILFEGRCHVRKIEI
mgnify:CR=1 FL=1